LEKLKSVDLTYQFLNSDNKYKFFEFLDNPNEILSVKLMAYNMNSSIWDKINSILNSDKSMVYRRLVNNTPISKSNIIDGNYKFDTSLTYFGIQKEKIFRKVNRKESLLKLKDTIGAKPIYPMLDEFGYHFTDFFIFKSSWDFEYHIETGVAKKSAKIETNEKAIDKLIERNKIDIQDLELNFNSFGKIEDFIPNDYGKIIDISEKSTSGSFPIKIKEDSVEANPYRPKIDVILPSSEYNFNPSSLIFPTTGPLKPPRPLPDDPTGVDEQDPTGGGTPDNYWNPDIPMWTEDPEVWNPNDDLNNGWDPNEFGFNL
jgi:hypothetical protein